MTLAPEQTNQVTELDADIAAIARRGGLLDQLRVRLAVSVRNSANETQTRSGGYASSPPWDGAHSGVYFTILAEAVALEADLRYRLTGRLPADRGRTHESAKRALNAIPALAAQQTDEVLDRTARKVAGWRRSIRSTPALDELTRQVRLQAPCPYCGKADLFVPFDASGDVVCRGDDCGNPDDLDSRGNPKPYRWPRHSWIRLLDTLSPTGKANA